MNKELQLSKMRNGFDETYSIPNTLKVSTTAILAAVGVILSYLNPFGYFYIFGAKINPFAHLINAVMGVLLGPIYAVICAGLIAVIRFSTGIGSILAFPGGMFGALIVGMVKLIITKWDGKKVKLAALTEPIGTVLIAAPISGVIVNTSIPTMMWLFALSCIPGCVMGWLLLYAVEKKGYFHYYGLKSKALEGLKAHEKYT